MSASETKIPDQQIRKQNWALAGFMLAAPFFVPSMMAMSGILLPASGLFFIWLAWNQKPAIQVLAFISNILILHFAHASDVALSIAPAWLSLCFVFRGLLRLQKGVVTAFLGALAAALILYAAEFLILRKYFGVSVLQWFSTQVEESIKISMNTPNSWLKKSVDELGKDAVVQQVVHEAPAVFMILLISSLWLNLWLASKAIKGFLSKAFWSAVRFPFWIVLPTLICASASLFLTGPAEWLGATFLKGLLTIHALQGLSVLSFFFNRMQLKGLIRWIMGFILVLGATPVLIAAGFFDQWFDFRRKIAL